MGLVYHCSSRLWNIRSLSATYAEAQHAFREKSSLLNFLRSPPRRSRRVTRIADKAEWHCKGSRVGHYGQVPQPCSTRLVSTCPIQLKARQNPARLADHRIVSPLSTVHSLVAHPMILLWNLLIIHPAVNDRFDLLRSAPDSHHTVKVVDMN